MIGVPLLEHDPELFAGLDECGLADARDAIVPAWQVAAGPWTPPPIDSARAPFGLLLLDGYLARETVLPDASSVEVLGPGDVMRLGIGPAEGTETEVEVEWEALATSVIAVLDVRFASVALRHPAVIATLVDRYIARAHWLAVQLAVGNIVGLDKRLETVLWQLAERWGRVTRDGVVLPMRFNHEFLAKLVGVRRPSVTSAVSRLRNDGVIERRKDGSWLLRRTPQAGREAPGVRMLTASR